MTTTDGADAPVRPAEAPTPTTDRGATRVARPPELVADSLGDYLRAWRRSASGGGDSGVLPVVGGLILISMLFQSLNSNFLTAGNLVNLLIQGAVYMLLAMGEVFALLLGEIDLSIGFVSGIGGDHHRRAASSSTYGWPWWAAIAVALLACARDRRAPGHDHHPARAAVVRRHARRPAGLAGRACC